MKKIVAILLASVPGLLLSVPTVRADDGPCPAPDCVSAPPCHKVCVREEAMKKIAHVEYSTKCEDFCKPCCGCWQLLFGRKSCGDDCAGCGKCGKPATRKILMKRTVTQECRICPCVPRLVPCATPCPTPSPAPAPCPILYVPGNCAPSVMPPLH